MLDSESVLKKASFIPPSLCSFTVFMNYEVAENIVLVINAVICLSYPLNFAIYCGMSRLGKVKVSRRYGYGGFLLAPAECFGL